MSTLSRLLAAPGTPDRPTPAQGLSGVFEEEPVPLEVFVTGKRYLNNPPLSPIQYDAVRHIEQIYLPETYPLMAEEFGDYWLPKRSINFATLQWGKGCKLGSMPIYDAETGLWVPVSEWRGGHVAGADEQGNIGVHAASESWVSGRGPSYRVTTVSGLVEEVYAGHRYLVRGKIDQRGSRAPRKYRSEWKHLAELGVGDHIAVPNALPEPLCPVAQPDEVVELLGLLLGDGCLPNSAKKRFAVSLTVGLGDTGVTDRFTKIVEGMGATVVTRSNDHRINLFAVGDGHKGGNPVINLAREHGMDGQEAANKVVPPVVFQLPTRQVALFLSRLIDTDGHIYVPEGAVPEVGYTTASRELAVGVQRLLLRLGCRGQLHTKRVMYQGEQREYYCVRMRDRTNVKTFCEQISTLSKESQRLAALAACGEGNGKTRARQGDLAWDRIVSIEPLGDQDYWDLEVPGVQNYVSNGTLNHNSGKDHICRVSSLRIAYLLLCLKSPQDYFSMPAQDIIHMLNVASNRSQAYQAFFKPMTKVVQTSGAWFEDKCQVRQDTIVWDKNVEMISGHADAESQEGLNLILGIADEIDAFKTKDELLQYRPNQNREPTKSAEAILKMIRTSASTRFPESYKVVTISYPRYLGSMIQVLTRDGQRSLARDPDGSREYVSGPHATWEVNPRVRGQEQFSKDYEDDPVMARTMYECKPARAVDPYFRNVDAVKAVFRQDSPLEVGYTLEDMGGSRIWKPEYAFDASLVPMQGANYVIHADLAIKGDRAGLAMSHVQSWTEVQDSTLGEDGEVRHFNELRPVVKVDFAFGYSADLRSDPAREIQIRWVRLLVAELRKRGFVISRVTFDQFQSSDSMQILEATGIPTQRVSVDRDETAWRTLRDLIYEGRISLPASALLEDELLGLKKLLNGKIDHPALGSKDVADAVAGSVLGALEEGGQENGLRSYGDSGAFSTFGLGQRPEFSRGLRGLEKPIMFR